MIHINADSYSVKPYNSFSVILENKRDLEARFYNTKASAAKLIIEYLYSKYKNENYVFASARIPSYGIVH